MKLLTLKKKITRAYQELVGCTIDDVPSFPGGHSIHRRQVINHYRKVKPSLRLGYLKAFRLFISEIKFEYEYKAPGEEV